MIKIAAEKVLVPIDFSEQSDEALEEAFALAASPADVTVLHVAPPLATYAVADPAIVWEKVTDEERARHLEESFRKQGDDPRRQKVKFEVVFGYPAEEVTKFAENHDIGMIVMPSHGRTGLSRMFVGSVAERVVRMAHCPVLVLRH